MVKWLNDHLATASTGGYYTLRQLYTTNTEKQFRARAHIMLNARTPQFKRDDVCDRLLILRVDRLEHFRPESELLHEIDECKECLWADYLTKLNKIVKFIGERQDRRICDFRMADWGGLALDISEAIDGKEAVSDMEKCLKGLIVEQQEFGLMEDPLYLALDTWLHKNGHLESDNGSSHPKEFKAGELFNELKLTAEHNSINWIYDNAISLARRLNNIRSELGKRGYLLSSS